MPEEERASEHEHVWVVLYSNYEPAGVDSIWATEDLAERRCQQLNTMCKAKGLGLPWTVYGWTVKDERDAD